MTTHRGCRITPAHTAATAKASAPKQHQPVALNKGLWPAKETERVHQATHHDGQGHQDQHGPCADVPPGSSYLS